MAIRKTALRRQVEVGSGSKARDLPPPVHGRGSLLGDSVLRFLAGKGSRRRDGETGELEALPLPDLLSPEASAGPDTDELRNLLELAFLGRASAGEMDRSLDRMPAHPSAWEPEHFSDDLFLDELVQKVFVLPDGIDELRRHHRFVARVLAHPPSTREIIRFRQAILGELESDARILSSFATLFDRLIHLMSLLRASRDDARLHPVRFRLDVLQAFRGAVELMDEGFAASRSGLVRLANAGTKIRRSAAFARLEALLDHQSKMATLQIKVVIGADGRMRHLEIDTLEECKGNPYYRRPLRRWWDRLRLLLHRYDMSAEEIVDRLVMGVYQEIEPALARLVQLLCHIEVYMAMRSFADDARSRGLEVCLAEVAPGSALEAEQLFNPLLLTMTHHPVPSDLHLEADSSIALVTGPNSGGKTRLLQAVGLAQLLGQSGFYTPARRARLPLASGMHASIIEMDRADQAEGRLGTELLRLRTLFETALPGSVVLLDELCSGTNPSEAIEIVDTVLRLLEQLEPVALVTTHFLDFAEQMAGARSGNGLCFLQAEVDAELGATYRFVPGVATTSLAVGTARRLGLTFDELEKRLSERLRRSED